MIEAKGIAKEYRSDSVSTTVLSGVSFNIEKGEFVAIVGHSGSGKSTLMHIMGFLDRPTSGTYKFDGQEMSRLSDDELAFIRNEKMGFIFQAFNLLARTSVFDNVYLPLVYSKKTKTEKNKMAKEAISAVGLSHRIKHYSNQLSGGEQQRVAIARAIVNSPDIIFADEPTGNLDTISGNQIMEILQDFNKQGRTIILVTHEKDISSIAKRIIELRDGKIISDKS